MSHPLRKVRITAALVALGVAAGCVLDPDEPPGALIRCTDDSECPNGFRCQPADNLCIQGPGFDGAPSLSTDLLGPGRTLTLSFVASEPLPAGGASAALVEAGIAAEQAPATRAFTQTAIDGRAYTFEVTDTAADPSGTYDVLVTLKNGAEQENVLRAGAVVVDNALPAVQPGAVLRRLPDSPLRGDALVDVRGDSAVEVTFATTEALSTSPVVHAQCGEDDAAPSVELQRVGDTTSVFVFVYRSTDLSSLDDGACSLRADLTDTAGNLVEGAVILEPAFAMDQTAPAAPGVNAADAIVYTRVPWGGMRDAASGQKTFHIDGAAGSTEPFAQLRLYESPAAPFEDAVGATDADANGAFAIALNPVDRAELWAAQTDPAGNEGPRARIRDVVWTATLGGKVSGSSFANPHRMEARSVFSPQLLQKNTVERGDEVARIDGRTGAVAGAASWQDITTDGAQLELENPAAAFDPLRGKLVAFGGAACHCAGVNLATCGGTNERDDTRWSPVAPRDPEGDGAPSRRAGASLVFDTATATTVLFGGVGPSGLLSDTWDFDGTSWRSLCTGACAAAAPMGRSHHAVAYDPVRRRVVLFGGVTRVDGALTLLNDTWEWDGAAWSLACTGDCVPPPARSAHRMAYDDVLHQVVLFGGDTSPPPENQTLSGSDADGVTNDMWAFDGTSWTALCDGAACAATRPPPRADFGMAYDAARGQLVIYGGLGAGPGDCTTSQTTATERLADTWTFDGTSWTEATPTDPENDGNPGARRLHTLVYDPRRSRTVLISGVADDPCFTLECTRPQDPATWEWDGTSWRAFLPVAQPRSALSGISPQPQRAAYDPSTDEVVLVQVDGAIDRWNGAWRPAADTTFHLRRPALTTSNGGLVLEAGRNMDNDTLSATTFVNAGDGFFFACFFVPCGAFPSARDGVAGAPDPLGGSVFFGGADSSGDMHPAVTFHFDGTWTLLAADPAPAPRANAGMAYDAARGVTVLFGGAPATPNAFNDTWEWDGAAWHDKSAPGPRPRREPGLWYDDARGRVILYGGDGAGFFTADCGEGTAACGDTWEWDGTAWTQPTIADVEDDGEPGTRLLQAVAYHPTQRRAVLFGGARAVNGAALSDTWLYDSGGDERPGMVFSALFAAAGTQGDEHIEDVRAEFSATGVGENDTTGIALWVWDQTGWRQLGTDDSDAIWQHSTTPLQPGADVLPRLFVGRERTLAFAVTPAVPSGARPAFGALDVDGAEVTVRYRLPPE